MTSHPCHGKVQQDHGLRSFIPGYPPIWPRVCPGAPGEPHGQLPGRGQPGTAEGVRKIKNIHCSWSMPALARIGTVAEA